MKILYIVNIPSPYRVEYFNQLGKRCDLTVLFERMDSSERDESWKNAEFKNFKGIVCKGKKIGVDSAFTKDTVKEIKKGNYDFIIVGNAMSLTGLYQIAYLKRKKIPYWIEGDGAFCPQGENKLKYLIKKYALTGAKGYFSTCENHDLYYMHYGVAEQAIYRYAFSSVKEEEVLKETVCDSVKQNIRKTLSMKEKRIVVSVGQFIHRKGFDLLIEAAKQLPKDTGFYLIGGVKPEDAEELENIHYINFLQKEELHQYYDAADCFVCPTREDIWGLVINEAMARSLPVITTERCNAGLTMIEEGKNGYLVPTEDAKALAEAIKELLEKEDLDTFYKNALAIAQKYTIERMVEDHLAVWKAQKKKILFLGYAVDKEVISSLSGGSVAGNKMQINVLQAMQKYVEEIYPITIYPVAVFPRDKKIFIKREFIDLKIGLNAVRVSFWNFPLLKQYSQIVSMYREAKRYIKKNRDAIVFTFNMYPQIGNPAVKLKKKFSSQVVSLLADLPIDDDYQRKGFSGFLRRIFDNQTKKNIKQADKLIVLNKNARNEFASGTDYIVIEGGINPEEFSSELPKKMPRTKNIVYGGSLQEYSGIKQLVESMELVMDEAVILDIYGDGALREFLENYPSDKVRYHGSVSNSEMLEIQKNAWLLVNPRPIEDAIAKVTFPSKMFEYLMSGVPVLATRLNGFLPEYEDKLFFAENNTKEELARKINEIAAMDEAILRQMASRARQFLMQEKNWDVQTKKMVRFMERESRLKVMTVNCMVHEGSTSKMIDDVAKLTAKQCRFFQCFQIGQEETDDDYLVASWNVTRFYFLWARIVGLKYGVGKLPTYRLIKHIRNVNPDVIHIHCPNFYNLNLYQLFAFLKKNHYPVVITNHAEFFYTGNCAHAKECEGYLEGCKRCDRVFDKKYKYIINRTHTEWKQMKKSFEHAENFVMTVVSPWQKERIKTSPITQGVPTVVVENGVNTEIFYKREIEKSKYAEFIEDGKKIILNVTSYFCDDKEDDKGGYYLLQVAKKMPEHRFLVAGNYHLKEKERVPQNVIFLGNIKEQSQLNEYYNLADLTLVTSKRETFGMACAESMLCGTPVVGYQCGGMESIALKEYSDFVPFADVDGLIKLIEKWLLKKNVISEEMAKKAVEKYSVEKMAKEYLALYQKMAAKKDVEL